MCGTVNAVYMECISEHGLQYSTSCMVQYLECKVHKRGIQFNECDTVLEVYECTSGVGYSTWSATYQLK